MSNTMTAAEAQAMIEDVLSREHGELTEAAATMAQSAAKMIYRMTDRNDHTGARLFLAEKVLKNKKLSNIMRAIQTLHDEFGHMPGPLLTIRDTIVWKMLDDEARQKLSPEDYDLIMQSF